MISPIHFGAMKLGNKGKVTITKDNKTGKSVVFSDWEISHKTQPPKAILKNSKGKKIAEYPVRKEQVGCLVKGYWIDQLDIRGLQG